MGTTDRLERAGWKLVGSLWQDPASNELYSEARALKTHARDVARGDGEAVDAELTCDADYLALLDARDLVELTDDEALSRGAPVTEADLYATGTAWAVGL